jgi:cytochrome c oxidase subunit 1
LLFIGFHMTFLIQHWLGVVGMPRRYATYLPSDGFTWMNQVSSFGAALLAISMIPFFLNVYLTARHAPTVSVNDPWGYGRSLEWATSCPPPRHNFVSIPRIRSESPAFDINHPEAGIAIGVGAKDAPASADQPEDAR